MRGKKGSYMVEDVLPVMSPLAEELTCFRNLRLSRPECSEGATSGSRFLKRVDRVGRGG